MDLHSFRKKLVELYSPDDIVLLADDAGMNTGTFSSANVEIRAKEILDFCRQNNKLDYLVKLCNEKRPDVVWADFIKPNVVVLPPAQTTEVQTQVPPPVPPIVGVWNVNTIFGFWSTTTIYANGAIQANTIQGLHVGQWSFNPNTQTIYARVSAMGMPIEGAFFIQQWLPNGFVALGSDGVLYTYIRVG